MNMYLSWSVLLARPQARQL